jgi:RNA polymerase sigma-70 factor (ECF subfamily)
MRRPTDYIEDYDPEITLQQDSTLEDEVMAQEKFEILCAAIATLPPQCRKIYLMRKVYGLSYKDIATALTLSVKTVEMHIQKGYSRCDQYMNKHLSDESRHVESRLVKKGGLKNG